MTVDPLRCTGHCRCQRRAHESRLVVVTGGPGAGKTALLELVRHHFCTHVVILPEAASVLFRGGFPRIEDVVGRRAAQRAIFHVQRELERVALERHDAAVILCDRGTVDGLAYWPDDEASFWREVGSAPAAERARYSSVVCMETPPASQYNHVNPLRVESAAEAARLQGRIAASWQGHPQLTVVPHRDDFLVKVAEAMAALRKTIPPCCATSE